MMEIVVVDDGDGYMMGDESSVRVVWEVKIIVFGEGYGSRGRL